MVKVKMLVILISVFSSFAYAGGNINPKFSEFPTTVSSGPFVKKIALNAEQEHQSTKWKKYIQTELLKPVNFSGHYRLVISKDGVLPQDCGNDGWVCGWVIDKLTGKVNSELPEFNGNTKYYSTIENGTPSPDFFDLEYYPNSSMIWISGQNIPTENKQGEARCANSAYNFKDELFVKLVSSRCEIDVGDDSTAEPYLP